MLIVIEQVSRISDSEVKVTFSSHIGGARADWDGKAPRSGATYDVEIDVSEKIVGEQNIFLCQTEECLIREDGDTIYFRGQIIAVGEEDGCLTVDIDGTSTFFDSVGVLFKPGDFVEIQTKEGMKLYDTNM
jgi:hypothetical protein